MSAAPTPLIFISHTTSDPRDSQRAHRLAAELNRSGARTWIAPDSIPAGSQWEKKLVSAIINECTHFLVILSAASIRSKWVLEELRLARHRRKQDARFPILPLVVGEIGSFKGSKFVAILQQIPYHETFAEQLRAVALATGLRARSASALPLLLPATEPAFVRFDLGWLSYKKRQASLVGRESELAALRDFYDSPDWLKWWVIEGPGGVGKSRLALESLLALPGTWERGFLETSGVVDDELVKLIPESATAIVVDDAAAAVRLIDMLLNHLGRSRELTHKIRILLLERTTESQQWWRDICHHGKDSQRERTAFLYRAEPLSLGRLNPSQQRVALTAFLAAGGDRSRVTLPCESDPFWSHIDLLSDHGRPLLLQVLAAAVAELGLNHLRSWKATALLEFLYDREMRAWERLCPDQTLRIAVRNIVAIATACRGFNFERHEKRILDSLKSAGLVIENDSGVWEAVYTLTGSTMSMLEPEIFGEYYLTRIWDKPSAGPVQPILGKMLAAFDLMPAAVGYTIRNAAADFPESDIPLWWIQTLAKERFNTDDQKLRIMELVATAVHAYARAKEFERMERCLILVREWARRLPDFGQEHNCLSNGAAIAIHHYIEARRFPQAREWMETLRTVATQFPAYANLQSDLVRGAAEIICKAGEVNDFETVESAIGPLEDVARRQIHLRAEELAYGAVNAALRLVNSDRPEAMARCLRIMQRLHSLRGGIDEPSVLLRYAGVAYLAVKHGLRTQQWGLLAWAFACLSNAHDEGSSDQHIQGLFTDALRAFRSDAAANDQAQLLVQAEGVSQNLSEQAAKLTVDAAESLIGELRILVQTHPEDWFLSCYHARGLCNAIAINSAAGDLRRTETSLEELGALRKQFPESMEIRHSAALGLKRAISEGMSAGRIDSLLDELRIGNTEARAQFWHDWDIAFVLAQALRRTVRLHLQAGRSERIPSLVVELQNLRKDFPWIKEFPITLARALRDVVAFFADTGAIEQISSAVESILGLREDIDEQTRSHIVEAFELAIRAYNTAGLQPEAGRLQLAIQNLPEAVQAPAPSPAVIGMQAMYRDSFSPGGIQRAFQQNI